MNNTAIQWSLASLVRLVATAFLLLATFYGLEITSWAQSNATGGQIVGQILDSTGAAVAGAEVTIRNLNTNYTRTATTTESGLYAVPQVPVGPYEVIVKVSGFTPASQELLVTLGSSVAANFSLAITETSEVVEVNGSNAADLNIQPTRSAAQAIIDTRQIQQLPANGRRFQDFLLLTPAVSVESQRGGLSLSGQRGINININIDGADFNQPFFGGLRGGERSGFAPTVSQESIQEFQVSRNTFSAEFGRSTGGVVNVITKSGTNEFHGSAFYLIRDQSLTAQDAFERSSLARQQQFGGSFGGPLVKNRTFFFSAVDIQKVTQPIQVRFNTLDTLNRRNTPGAQALLAVAPEEAFQATNDAQVALGRIDHQLTQANNLSVRFNFSNNTGENAVGVGNATQAQTINALSNNGVEKDRTYTLVSQLTSVISSKILNEFRFQYAREERPRKNNGTGPEVTVVDSGQTIAIFGRRSFLPIEQFDDRFQFTNNLSVIAGPHTFKFGVDFNRVFVDQVFRSDAGGVYRFNSLDDLANRRPNQFRQFVGSGQFSATQKELAFYVQDEWRIRPGLTLNPGFRYEATFNPDYIDPTRPQNRAPQATSIPDDKEQYGPRLGIAWDVRNNGKTVVRAGGGLFYARTPLLLFNQAITNNGGNPELGFSAQLNGSAIGAAFNRFGINLANAPLGQLPIFNDMQLQQLFSGPSGALVVAFFDSEFRNPKSTQFNIGIDQQVAPGIIVGANFSYINTVRLERLRDVNVPAPRKDALGRNIFDAPRPNPRFSTIRSQESSARSLYRALTLSLNVRKQRFVFDAYYTLSTNYSDDDNERNFAGIMYDDVTNLRNEFNFSNLDQRHQFTTNAVVDLFFGFQLSGTARLNSAAPFTAQVGQDLNRDNQFPAQDRPIIDGRVIKRNTFRNFSFSDISMRLQKSFNMPSEKGKITASIEMFNLFGFDNVTLAGANQIFGPGTAPDGRPVPPPLNFRRLRDNQGNFLRNNLAGPPFQVQVGLRYAF
jgi:Carboxypeptidase regulatory-like domain/TonB dependent receptor